MTPDFVDAVAGFPDDLAPSLSIAPIGLIVTHFRPVLKVRSMLAQDTPRNAVSPWLTSGVCLWLAASAAAQAPQSKTIIWGGANADSVKHYGILGEVLRPGVYSTDMDATLQAVVQSAGGLTGSASPSIRIVRGDRGGQTVFFNPQGRDPLRPGDFIVVDVQPRPNSAPAPAGVSARPDGVWIGLSGVMSRPVVVRLHPQDAYLRTIIEGGLRQSTQLARAARMVLPPQTVSYNAGQDQIPNGTIIGVPATLLVQAEIPALPPTIAMTVEAMQPSTPTSNLFDPGLLRPQTVDLSNNGSFAPPQIAVPAPPSESLANTSRPFDRDVTANTLPFSAARDLEIPANPASLPAPGSRLATQFAPPTAPAAPTAPVRVEANLTAMDPATEADSASDLVGEGAIASKPNTFSLWQMLGIGGTVASLVGLALGTRQYLDRTLPVSGAAPEFRRPFTPPLRETAPVETPAQAAVIVERAPAFPTITPIPLSALLKNSIPIVTEPAEFPEKPRLQRPSGAATTMWRLDEAELASAPAPHLDPAAIAVPAPILELDESAANTIPRPHFRTLATFTPAGDLAAAAAEEAPTMSRAESAAAPSSFRASGKTSVERALSQLQRGRHA